MNEILKEIQSVVNELKSLEDKQSFVQEKLSRMIENYASGVEVTNNNLSEKFSMQIVPYDGIRERSAQTGKPTGRNITTSLQDISIKMKSHKRAPRGSGYAKVWEAILKLSKTLPAGQEGFTEKMVREFLIKNIGDISFKRHSRGYFSTAIVRFKKKGLLRQLERGFYVLA